MAGQIPEDRSTEEKIHSCYHCGTLFKSSKAASQCEGAHQRNGAPTG